MMPSLILDLDVDRVDLVDEGANSAAHIRLYKRKENESSMELDQILAKMKPEHASVISEAIEKAKEVPEAVAEELKKAKDKIKDMESTIAKSKEDTSTEPTEEDIIKNLDPSVQKIFKSLKSQKEAAEQVAREAADKAATEEAIAKAKDLKALPVEEEKLVEVLKGITPEVLEILKSANKAIEDSSVFVEVGKSIDETTSRSSSSSDAWSKIEKAAKKISEDQNITIEKATTIAVQENPDLYREYLKGGAN